MIQALSVGPLGENVYIVHDQGATLAIVDPGAEPDAIAEAAFAAASAASAASAAIILTHGHLDHVAGLSGLLSRLASRGLRARVYAPAGDRGYFGERAREAHARLFAGMGARSLMDELWADIPEADEYFGDGFVVPGTGLRAIHTPGHTRGSSCFLTSDGADLIAGDTLFRDGRGRTDGFDSDEADIVRSIRDKLCSLPDEVRVWPGHGEPTTIGREKRYYLYY